MCSSQAVTTLRQLVRHTVLSATLVAGVGCARAAKNTAPATRAPDVVLVVSNRGFFDVNVYVVRSAGVTGRRIATVSGGGTATIKVPDAELQPGGRLQVNVRAIGARTAWTSPTVSVGSSTVARLDVLTTNSGDLSQSVLYTASSR
jgi:hypothetical protein